MELDILDLCILCSHTHNFKLSLFSFRNSQNQNQNCLLVTRQNNNHSPGPGPGRLVPSSHQRSELSNTILGTFRRGDKRVWKCIPIPNSLEGKATLINISISNGESICHRMMIPAAPNQGDKVICWYTGLTFQTFQNSDLIFSRSFVNMMNLR